LLEGGSHECSVSWGSCEFTYIREGDKEDDSLIQPLADLERASSADDVESKLDALEGKMGGLGDSAVKLKQMQTKRQQAAAAADLEDAEVQAAVAKAEQLAAVAAASSAVAADAEEQVASARAESPKLRKGSKNKKSKRPKAPASPRVISSHHKNWGASAAVVAKLEANEKRRCVLDPYLDALRLVRARFWRLFRLTFRLANVSQ
jgi:hypothetical protein